MTAETTAAATWVGDRPTLRPAGSPPLQLGVVTELCLAVLLAGALAWWLMTRARPGPRVALRLQSATGSLTATGRDRESPDLTLLCLRRC